MYGLLYGRGFLWALDSRGWLSMGSDGSWAGHWEGSDVTLDVKLWDDVAYHSSSIMESPVSFVGV